MTLLEIRKWQIERAFEAATKQADAQRQTAERLFLANVAFAAAAPVYLGLLEIRPTSYLASTIWIPLFVAFVGSIFAHINSFDMQKEASENIGKHVLKLGQPDVGVDFGHGSLRSFKNARKFVTLTVLALGIGSAVAVGFAAYRTWECIGFDTQMSSACTFSTSSEQPQS